MVSDALRECGVGVELLTDHFAPDAKDTEWLPEVGKRGWVILSKDTHLRHNYLEIVGLLKSGAAAFLLTSGNLTGQEMADAYVRALPDMKKMLAKFALPFVATVSKGGAVSVKYTYDGLIKQISSTSGRAKT